MHETKWFNVMLVTLFVAFPALCLAQSKPASADKSSDTLAETKTYAAARVSNPLGKALPCASLKKSIEEKLQAKNVPNYQLDIVDIAEKNAGKIVGRCDGGKRQITYSKK